MDLGAHIGSFTVLAAKQASRGKVYAFEAMKDNYEVLCSNVELNGLGNVIANNIGVSNENESRTFYLSTAEAGRKVGYGTGGHSFSPSKGRGDSIEVQTETLDAIVKKYSIERINYLKIDTEGAEYDILFSASKETMAKVDKIAMELHPYDDNTKDKMLQFLEEHVFKNIVDNYGEQEFMVYSTR